MFCKRRLPDLGKFCAQRRLLIVLDDAAGEAERLVPGGRSSTLIVKRGAGPRPAMQIPAAVQACGHVPFRPALIAEIASLDVSAAGQLLEELVGSVSAIQLDPRYPRYVVQSAAPHVSLARAHA